MNRPWADLAPVVSSACEVPCPHRNSRLHQETRWSPADARTFLERFGRAARVRPGLCVFFRDIARKRHSAPATRFISCCFLHRPASDGKAHASVKAVLNRRRRRTAGIRRCSPNKTRATVRRGEIDIVIVTDPILRTHGRKAGPHGCHSRERFLQHRGVVLEMRAPAASRRDRSRVHCSQELSGWRPTPSNVRTPRPTRGSPR